MISLLNLSVNCKEQCSEEQWFGKRFHKKRMVVKYVCELLRNVVSFWLDHVCVHVCAQLLSHTQLFSTPWTVACQAPPSMGFSRQEYWSRLPFPPPGELPNPGTEPRSPESPAL